MAVINITIPDNKVTLVKNAIMHHTGAESITNIEAVEFVQDRCIANIRQLVQKYQEKLNDDALVLTDPIIE